MSHKGDWSITPLEWSTWPLGPDLIAHQKINYKKKKRDKSTIPVCTDVVKGTHMLPKGTEGEETDLFKGERR